MSGRRVRFGSHGQGRKLHADALEAFRDGGSILDWMPTRSEWPLKRGSVSCKWEPAVGRHGLPDMVAYDIYARCSSPPMSMFEA